MDLHGITLFYEPLKAPLVVHFYREILGLPEPTVEGEEGIQWFASPVHLNLRPRPEGEAGKQVPMGGFTGIQFFVSPGSDLNPVVARLRATGLQQPPPREAGDNRLLTAHDPSGHPILLIGSDEAPDEPLIADSVGAISLFVSDIDSARAFYLESLGLPLKAAPHEGLLVFGRPGRASLLVYQVPEGNAVTPIGRQTGIALSGALSGERLSGLVSAGGEILDTMKGAGDGLVAATVSDPEGNIMTLLEGPG